MRLRDIFSAFRKAPKPLELHSDADTLYALCFGEVAPMEELPDPTFSSGVMGKR